MSTFNPKGSSRLKKKHFRPKHQKAKLFRANEPLLSVFMWGANHTINALTHVNVPVMLMPDDFKAFSKIKVDQHHFNKENMPSHFKNSLTKRQANAIESPGRSGAKFYMSYDRCFLIKTLQSEEVEQMHVLLKHYHPYVVERHGKTLLPQYLGMYRLTVEGQETYLVIIRNIFSSYLKIHVKYDLKGSTVDREASEKEREKDIPTLKDNDFVKDGRKVYLSTADRDRFFETLTADVNFLSRMNVMDYSLCIGIHDCSREDEDVKKQSTSCDSQDNAGGDTEGAQSKSNDDEDDDDEYCSGDSGGGAPASFVPTPPDSPGPHDDEEVLPPAKLNPKRDIYAIHSYQGAPKKEVYFMAMVDVLTNYGVKKRTAQAAKTLKHGAGAEISTVHPEQYAKRFLDFISNILSHNNTAGTGAASNSGGASSAPASGAISGTE